MGLDGFCKCLLDILDSEDLVIPNLQEGFATDFCPPRINSRAKGTSVHATYNELPIPFKKLKSCCTMVSKIYFLLIDWFNEDVKIRIGGHVYCGHVG